MDARQANFHYALHCAKLGLYVFPCRPGDKRPLVKWRRLSTVDPEQIKQWWTEYPDALPAVDLAKSGHVVTDADRHGGPDGVVALERLFAEHNTSLTDAPGVISPRDGRHSWFKQPNGEPLGNRDKPIRDLGVNIRGAGGFVIAPGAQLPDGRRYTRDKDTPNLFVALREDAVPVLPEWFAELLRPKSHHDQATAPGRPAQKLNGGGHRHHRYAETTLDRLCDELASTPKRSRNIELNNAALRMGHMVASGWIDRSIVEQRLYQAAKANGLIDDPDDGPGKTLDTIAGGINAGLKEPHRELEDRPQQPRRQSEKQQPDDLSQSPAFTEDALALLFADQHSKSLRYVAALGKWLIWNDTRWCFDETLLMRDRARYLCRDVAGQCNEAGPQKNYCQRKDGSRSRTSRPSRSPYRRHC